MEKMLSKSKSRFFGKKKSSKSLGISSTDPPTTEHEKMVREGFAGPSILPTPPTSAPRMASGGGTPVMVMNGSSSRLHHAGSSSADTGRPMGLHNHENSTTSSSRPSHPSSVSQSRCEVHIGPTAFSPIIIPSSTPPESATTSPQKHRDISTQGSKHGVTTAERPPHVGVSPIHGQSQSSASNETPNSRARSRRHGIPANFLESVGAVSGGTKAPWNGQSLGAGHILHSQTPRDRSPSSFPSQSALVHPSASAPVTSCLSNADTGLNVLELAPMHESSTDPGISSSSNGPSCPTSIPRSIPRYNLASFAPSASGMSDPRHRPIERGHRCNPPPQPVPEASHRFQDSSPQPLSSSSPTGASEATLNSSQSSNHHRMNPSVSSETEIGYKGLAFPLPPSNEEGLATSFSSSQSSLFSTTASGRRSGDQPLTPKKVSNGKFYGEYEHDSKPLGSMAPRGAVPGSGRIERERNVSLSVSENRASPTSNMRTARRKPEDVGDDFSRMNGDEERGTIRHQDRVAKELEDVLSAKTNQGEHLDDVCPVARIRAISEAPRLHPASSRPQKYPEPTKPLVLNPSRKTLHTTRSFTSLTDRKQIHTSSSTRDLSGTSNSALGRSERVRAATAIPVRAGPGLQRDRDGHAPVPVAAVQTQSPEDQLSIPPRHAPVSVAAVQTHSPEAQSSTPPSFPLPTPPNSSSALNFLTSETKTTEVIPFHPDISMGTASTPPLTLEEVMQALRTQHMRFDELASHVLDVTQRHTAEKDACMGRVGRLEDTVAKLEREIRGLRWLVLENTKMRAGVVSNAALILDALATDEEKSLKSMLPGEKDDSIANDRKLRRSSTLPPLPTLAHRPGHARNRRFGGLGLDLSPESAGSSPLTLATPSRYDVEMGDAGDTPSMDEIIDKLMAVRQWAGSDVRVSVVESTGDAGDSKRIVFRQV